MMTRLGFGLTAACAALLATTSAQDLTRMPDPAPDGGLEENAALYFAPPQAEGAESVIDPTAMRDAGTVALAIALGRVETALDGCAAMRRDMTTLIGETYGSYTVEPGWLRLYQSCILKRADETKLLSQAIRQRQTALLEAFGSADPSEEDGGEAAMRAADLMARLSARQSGVKLAVRKEARLQKALVRYYNTGELPDELREAAGAVPTPGGEPSTLAPAELVPGDIEEPLAADAPGSFGGALVVPDMTTEPPAATAKPLPLRSVD